MDYPVGFCTEAQEGDIQIHVLGTWIGIGAVFIPCFESILLLFITFGTVAADMHSTIARPFGRVGD